MEPLSLLQDLVVVFAASAGVVFLFQHLRVPAVVGLLVAGVVVGPYGLRLVAEVERVNVLAEVGVVVLLFTVGLEFSLSRLWRLREVMLTIGVAQVLLTGAVATLATAWYLETWGQAVFAGMLVAMSSTAVVLKILGDRGEMSAPHGRLAVAILLLQDFLVLVFMVLLPVLAAREDQERPVWLALGQGLAAIAVVLLAARYVVPPVLFRVVRTRNRELFLLTIVVVVLGTAALTAWSGLSLALGAFLAGLALADSEYAHQTLAEVLPFRDTLSSLFFVSVGMLLNVGFVAEQWPLVLITVAAIAALKFAAVALPTWVAGYPLRVAVLAGMALPQVGEFSFVLAGRGIAEFGLLRPEDYQTFLAAAVLTMGLTPLAMAVGPRLVERLPVTAHRSTRLTRVLLGEHGDTAGPISDHVIIAGFGVNGRNVARGLREVGVPFVILEMNPVTVRELRRAGEPVHFGDCSRPAVLDHAGIRSARAFVVAISDPASTRRAVTIARQLHPQVHILVRTRYVAEVEELRKLGADQIIPEEFETSVEIFSRVLREYNVPLNVIEERIRGLRRDHYGMLRDVARPSGPVELPFNLLADIDIESWLVRDVSPVVGRTLSELHLRAETGATVIAVRRGDRLMSNPGSDFRIEAGDVVILVGDRAQISSAVSLLETGESGLPNRSPGPHP
jgi:CPA2 family monovalent cation:H+ antiporter-2